MEQIGLSLKDDFKTPLKPSEFSLNSHLKTEKDFSISLKSNSNYKLLSFLNNLFICWTNKSMSASNKKNLSIKILIEKNINHIKPLYQTLYSKWYNTEEEINYNFPQKNYNINNHKKGYHSLFMSILSSNTFHIIFVLLLSILLSLVKLFQLFFERKLIKLFKLREKSIRSQIPITAMLFLINKFIQIFLNSHTMHQSQTLGIKAGNMLSALVYEKVMRTAIFLKNQVSEGEVLNYLQIDINTLGFVFFYAPLTIVVPFQFGVYIYMLFSFFGKYFIFGFCTFLFLFIIAWVIQKLYITNQRILLKNKDQRMKITSNTLHILKVLKLYAWEEEFIKRINKVRNEEINSLKKIQNVFVLSGFIHSSIPNLLAVVSIGIYALVNGNMPIENLLTSIEIFDSMASPLYRLPIFITSLINCIISMKRIENFLNERDIEKSSSQSIELKEEKIAIKFEKCNFGIKYYRNLNDKVLLKDINLLIKQGELVAVLGETGSGKTCLANAILNYYEQLTLNREEKSINVVNGRVSYASQNPWIMNESIKNNILFFNEYDEERYQKVLDICQLYHDLELLPGGEFTEVSSNGNNISGGQKARISLARAIYQNADIYLFDDPMSSVDSIISMEIFNKVLVNYLRGKTRILIRNHIQNLHLVNKIIYIDKGRVIWTGTYSEFTRNILYKQLADEIQKKTVLEEKEKYFNQRKQSIQINEEYDSRNMDEKMRKGRLIKDEEMTRGKIRLGYYLKFIKLTGGYRLFFILIFLALIVQLAEVGEHLWLMHWSTDEQKNNLYNFLIYFQIALFCLFFLFLKEFLSTRTLLYINKALHAEMLKKIIFAPINLFHDVVPIGQSINRLTSDLEKIKVIIKVLSQLLRAGSALICSIYVCSKFSFSSLLSAPLMVLIGFLITSYYINAGRDLNRLDGISRTPIVTCFSETITGSSTIRAFKVQHNFKERFFKLLNNYFIVNSYKFGAGNWYALHLELSSFCYTLILVVIACIFRDNFTPQAIGLLLKYSLIFSDQMLSFFSEISNIEKSMVSYERCNEYTKLVQEKSRTLPKDSTLISWPQRGEIQMINYTTRYRPETDIVLYNINIHIKPGEKIGIVGRSGSGKSTLALAIYRIIEPCEGSIIIDDVNIETIGLKKLRESMCIVPQDPTLIEGTLRDNVDPLNKYSDDEIIEVLEEIELFDLMRMKRQKGTLYPYRRLNFKIKEFGNNLSLGEKQLVCFARAILKKSKIIFLDEATSSLDQKTEDAIQKAINKHFKDCTVLTIAHRVQTIKNSDRVLVLENGKIAEFDCPENLLKNQKGKFNRLYFKNIESMVDD